MTKNIMSSPTFITLPREIRDRVYDFFWDLGQMVSPSASSPTFTTPPTEFALLRNLPRFDCLWDDVTLALLQVNRQVSAEAASALYGKRTFCIKFSHLLSFLHSISRRRHLIKDIQVYEFSLYDSRFCSPTFSLLQNLDRLRSFTIVAKTQNLKRILEHPVCIGIHELTDRMDVTIYSEYDLYMPFAEDGIPETTLERVMFRNAWKCAKGEKEWRSQGSVKGGPSQSFMPSKPPWMAINKMAIA